MPRSEYTAEFSSLKTGLKILLSQAVTAASGEDPVEKQDAEQRLMAIIDDEAGLHSYTSKDRHFVEGLRRSEMLAEMFHDGVAVAHMPMALHRSAGLGRAVSFAEWNLDDSVPVVERPQSVPASWG